MYNFVTDPLKLKYIYSTTTTPIPFAPGGQPWLPSVDYAVPFTIGDASIIAVIL